MIQTKFSLKEDHIHFLGQYKKFGFKDKSAVIRAALDRLQKDLEKAWLKKSADLYAELYDEDKEVRKLTESALAEWPE